MNRAKVFILLVASACSPTCSAQDRNAQDTAPAGAGTQMIFKAPDPDDPNLALLVGINRYPNLAPKYQLNGCVNDVELIKRLLTEVFHFKAQNILVLRDEQATRANIERAFQAFLIRHAQPKGQAVFFYSGHGGKMTDLNHDEGDGYDETILPSDARDPSRTVLDIADETLGTWLRQLTDRCDNVTAILDCCHSGSGTRGDFETPSGARARFADTLRLKSVESVVLGQNTGKGPSGFLQPNPKLLLVAGSQDNEYAKEYRGNGALTRALNKVLRKNPNATYRQMLYAVTEEVTSVIRDQHPQLEGERRDAIVFGDLGKVQPFLEVVKKDGNRLIVSGGRAHGVTQGSIYEIYPPGTINPDNRSKRLGKVTISAIGAFKAWADITEEKGKIRRNAAAFEVAHQYGDLQLPVLLALDRVPKLKTRIEQILEQYHEREDLVKLVPMGEDFAVKIAADPDRDTVALLQPDASLIKRLDPDDPEFKWELTETLTAIARWRNLFDLENTSDLQVALIPHRWQFDEVAEEVLDELPIEETPGGQRLLHEKDVFSITFINHSPRPIYVYLLDLGTDGSISLLYPDIGARDSPIAPGDSVSSGLLEVGLPQGLEALKLIATNKPADFAVLMQKGYRGLRGASGDSTGLDSPLGRLLNMAYGGTRTSGKKATHISDWTTERFTFLVRARVP